MRKPELRKTYLEKRKALSPETAHQHSQVIAGHFLAWKKTQAPDSRCIHVFLPIVRNKEVDTFRIIERYEKEIGQVEWVVPVTDTRQQTLRHCHYREGSTLQENAWGIPEPAEEHPADLSRIDLVLVPMLVCDSSGGRVGYGKGFYDAFLGELPAHVKKIGLSFFPPLQQPIEDLHEGDVPLDHCITPEGVWNF